MFARITIQSGVAAGTSHRINRRVARVGSDPQADVCLPSAEIPGHALTLEFREESCFVYNRCQESVYVGGQVVEPEQVVEWPETDILQLGQNIELLLDFEDSETEEAFTDYGGDEETADSETLSASSSSANSVLGTEPQSKSLKTAIQLGVTFLCIAGCALLLIRDQNRKSAPDSGPGFSEIISTALAERDIAPELIQRLQHAEAQRVRGRKEVANDEYQSIRDDLVSELDQAENTAEKRNAQILRFVQTRLTP